MALKAGRLLILGAGTAAAENLLRSLRYRDPSLVVLGYYMVRDLDMLPEIFRDDLFEGVEGART